MTNYQTDANLRDVVSGGDADETPLSELGKTQPKATTVDDKAAAMKGNKKPGPADAPVQVRPAGADAQANTPKDWDAVDEAVDESFPASDASAKY